MHKHEYNSVKSLVEKNTLLNISNLYLYQTILRIDVSAYGKDKMLAKDWCLKLKFTYLVDWLLHLFHW